MLSGLQLAWFRVMRDAWYAREAASRRRQNDFGILVETDEQALRYQYADARKDHAERHLAGPAIVHSWSSNEGDVTDRDNREWARRRAELKRKALSLLKPIFDREEADEGECAYAEHQSC